MDSVKNKLTNNENYTKVKFQTNNKGMNYINKSTNNANNTNNTNTNRSSMNKHTSTNDHLKYRELKATIKKLKNQGFFPLPLKNNGQKDSPGKMPALPRKQLTVSNSPFKDIPSQSEALRRAITDEEWERIFKHKLWKDVTSIGIVGGHCGVAIFDFDIKGLGEGDLDQAIEYWGILKEGVKQTTDGEYYLEKTPSGGEHLIVMVDGTEEVWREHLRATTTQTPWGVLKGARYVEFLGFNTIEPGQVPSGRMCTIAPSPGYTKLEGKELADLCRVDVSVIKEITEFLKSIAPKKGLCTFKKDNGNLPRFVKQKDFASHLEELKERNDIGQKLEQCGYKRCGDRFLAPGSKTGNAGVMIFENGKKFRSFHASDTFNDDKAHDVIDIVLKQNGGDWVATLKELGGDVTVLSNTPQNEQKAKKKAEEEAERRKNCSVEVTEVIRDVEDKLNKTYSLKNPRGDTIDITSKEMINVPYMTMVMQSLFERYMDTYGSIKGVRFFTQDISRTSNDAPEIKGLSTRKWVDGRLFYKSTDNLRLLEDTPMLNVKGTFEEWMEHVGSRAKLHKPSVFAMVIAFASPLCKEVLGYLFAVNLFGLSQSGKSTALMVANSLATFYDNGKGAQPTLARLEVDMRESAYRLLVADEVGEANKEFCGGIATICGITGKTRAKWSSASGIKADKVGGASSLLLTAGESKYREVFASHGIRISEGRSNRYLEIEVRKEDVECSHARELGKIIQRGITKYYGTPMEKFLNEIPHLNEVRERWDRCDKECMATDRLETNFKFLRFVANLLEELKIFPSDFKFVDAVDFYTERHKKTMCSHLSSGSGVLECALQIIDNTKYYINKRSSKNLGECFIFTQGNDLSGLNNYSGYDSQMYDEGGVNNDKNIALLRLSPLYNLVKKEYSSCSKGQLVDILVDAGVFILPDQDKTSDKSVVKHIPVLGLSVRVYLVDLQKVGEMLAKEIV